MKFIFNPARRGGRARFAFTLIFAFAFIGVSLFLWACGLSAPGGTETTVEVQLGEPILFNEPVPVTITVQTPEDIQGLEISMSSDRVAVVVEGEKFWTFDALANQPIQVTSTVRFTMEGYYDVFGYAHDPHKGGTVIDYESVHLTLSGGILNPSLETSTPFILNTPDGTQLTESAILDEIPTDEMPTLWNRSIPI